MWAIVLLCAAVASSGDERPLAGDVVHGQALLQKAGGSVRVDGAWLNSASDDADLAFLASGKNDFPQIDSDDVLDRWDVLAFLRSKNTDLRDMLMGANNVLVADEKLDENAEKRLTDQGKLAGTALSGLRVFSLYKLGGDGGLNYVSGKDNKARDKLKKNTKVGYVVFAPLPGFRGGKYEVAFAVDKDIHLQHVFVRAPDGDAPTDLNQAAARFVGKGARGQYAELKAGGAGKAIGEIEKPLSQAFLVAMENVYMFEIAEKDYFAFGD
jgi:hypothetical protein